MRRSAYFYSRFRLAAIGAATAAVIASQPALAAGTGTFVAQGRYSDGAGLSGTVTLQTGGTPNLTGGTIATGNYTWVEFCSPGGGNRPIIGQFSGVVTITSGSHQATGNLVIKRQLTSLQLTLSGYSIDGGAPNNSGTGTGSIALDPGSTCFNVSGNVQMTFTLSMN